MPAFAQLAFTPEVQEAQASAYGMAWDPGSEGDFSPDRLGPAEAQFIAARDTFFMATVGSGGWPYVQHRGGPAGFVRVLDEATLAFADFRGNRQLISTGNLAGGEGRVALIFVDFARRRRLKVLATARVVTASEDPDLIARIAPEGTAARVERAFVLTVRALDWNCPQHIVPRYTEREIEAAIVAPLKEEIARLRATLDQLRKETAQP
ncbi:MAG: pyridoxamine 5'-phosphate oxidase family protein [Sumerlaeia bacterium]